jgi:hypothetical protein
MVGEVIWGSRATGLDKEEERSGANVTQAGRSLCNCAISGV